MNQILFTGEEGNAQATKKIKKQKKVLPINGIIVFFVVSIIILGICMITGGIYGVYSTQKINASIIANTKPVISIERNDDDTIKITVTHIRKLKSMTYKWNDGEEVMVDARSEKSLSETIDLIHGENTLKITAIDENGQQSKLEKKYVVGNIPTIEIKPVDNGIQIIASCEEKIDYVQYNWDDGENQKIEVGDKKYEGIINAPKGKHRLKIEVVNVSGAKANEERTIVGDIEPTLNVESKLINGKATFIIDVEDDEKITTLEIIHNGGEKQTIDVNAKTYHKEVVMTEGEENTIIVRATNVNGLTKTRGVKFDNK